MAKEEKCTVCQRGSEFDRCACVECPKRKQMTARQTGAHTYTKEGSGGRYQMPSQRTDRDWD